MPPSLRSEFLLEPGFTYLNHGSFGACPRKVFNVYQHYQYELERHPGAFMHRLPQLLAESRAELAHYLNIDAADVVYFPNPTTALSAAFRSMHLQPGDEILSTDHEYGAMDRAWRFVCQKTGARYIRQPIPLPVTSPTAVADALWAGVTERTRIIFLSHITSPTALILPVKEIARRARAAGILSIVDGAHAPGQIAVDLADLGVDIYAGSCHKWMCAPKGTAFLYARREVQSLLEPLVVSFGWESDHPGPSRFQDYYEWQGTRDPSSYLTVPAVISFQAEHDWPSVRSRCRALASDTRRRVDALTGLDPICPDSPEWFAQMASVRLPDVDVAELNRRLYNEFHIEVPTMRWNNQPLMRLSFQAYNSEEDADTLLNALERLLPELQASSQAGRA
jgi:isopenicillin-N epimerase